MQKVVREIIKIDEELCDGCGDCIVSCEEGALEIIDGKAKLIRELYCDGLAACIGSCPTGALTIEEREADEYDQKAVDQHLATMKKDQQMTHQHQGCPGAMMRDFSDNEASATTTEQTGKSPSELRQWPIELKLVPPTAPYYQGADVLLAADCVPFALPDFHRDHLKGRSLAIACPKLDSDQEIYVDKIRAMIDEAKVNTLTVIIMEVPCCSGLVRIAMAGAEQATRKVPLKAIVVGVRGEVLSEEWL